MCLVSEPFGVPASYVKKVEVQEGEDSDPELAQLVNVYLVNVYLGDATFEEGEGEDKKEVTAQVMSRVTIGGKVVIDTIGMNTNGISSLYNNYLTSYDVFFEMLFSAAFCCESTGKLFPVFIKPPVFH